MIQRNAEIVGKYGCYFLSILHLAEIMTGQPIDPVRAYQDAIRYGFMDRDCYILEPGHIMAHYTRTPWSVTKEKMDYELRQGELEIIRYEWKEPMNTRAHFVVGDCSGGLAWDPYGTSETVANGEPVSKRIFRRAA